MKLKEFKEQAKRTFLSTGNDKLDLCHMTLGITSEIVELSEAVAKNDVINLIEEATDIMWYIVNTYTLLNEDVSEPFLSDIKDRNTGSLVGDLYDYSSHLSNIVKRHIAYGKELDLLRLTAILDLIQDELINRVYVTEHVFSSALNANIEKLKVRYPEKFTTENALHRDLKKEREVLEKETNK